MLLLLFKRMPLKSWDFHLKLHMVGDNFPYAQALKRICSSPPCSLLVAVSREICIYFYLFFSLRRKKKCFFFGKKRHREIRIISIVVVVYGYTFSLQNGITIDLCRGYVETEIVVFFFLFLWASAVQQDKWLRESVMTNTVVFMHRAFSRKKKSSPHQKIHPLVIVKTCSSSSYCRHRRIATLQFQRHQHR